GASPGDGLATRGKKRANALAHGVLPIVRNEIRKGIECVAHQRNKVGLLCAKSTHRLKTKLSGTPWPLAARSGTRTAFKESELRLDFGRAPGNLYSPAQVMDAQAHAFKQVLGREVALADHLR